MIFVGAFLLIPILSILKKESFYITSLKERMDIYNTVNQMNQTIPNTTLNNWVTSNQQIIL